MDLNSEDSELAWINQRSLWLSEDFDGQHPGGILPMVLQEIDMYGAETDQVVQQESATTIANDSNAEDSGSNSGSPSDVEMGETDDSHSREKRRRGKEDSPSDAPVGKKKKKHHSTGKA
ncbi:hypothetical protein N7486_000248 [Penicillium sp. IBT 16267x]|nr:hypothetical protein N7486_000248 [Penicillium sp. IBT 16267x]